MGHNVRRSDGHFLNVFAWAGLLCASRLGLAGAMGEARPRPVLGSSCLGLEAASSCLAPVYGKEGGRAVAPSVFPVPPNIRDGTKDQAPPRKHSPDPTFGNRGADNPPKIHLPDVCPLRSTFAVTGNSPTKIISFILCQDSSLRPRSVCPGSLRWVPVALRQVLKSDKFFFFY